MAQSKSSKRNVRATSQAKPAQSAFAKAMHEMQHQQATAFPNISARWLAGAAAIALAAAAACAWLTLCLLYGQGSWQLLYHPKAAITRTPASAGLTYKTIHFAATETGIPQLTGWWIPVEGSQITVLYLHGADGDLSDTVDALAALHQAGFSIFAIDYRGYGQSQPAKPSEHSFRQDAESALSWLTQTHGAPAHGIVIYGSGLGANLAAELAGNHNELAGVVLEQPLAHAMDAVFSDKRSRLVPAHWLVRDRYDLGAASASLRIPSLWLLSEQGRSSASNARDASDAYGIVPFRKAAVWLKTPAYADLHYAESLKGWMDDL